MRITRALFATGLFFLATGYTDCNTDAFETVTVPVSDEGDPIAWGGVYTADRVELARAIGLEELNYVARPGQRFFVVAGGLDGGGVEFVKLEGFSRLTCKRNGQLLSGFPKWHDVFDAHTQQGAVHNRVSNGMYGRFEITVPRCPSAATSGDYLVEFQGTAIDFHGNLIDSPKYHVTARPF